MDDWTTRFRPEFAALVREHANRAPGFVTLLGLSVEEYGPGTVRCRLPYRPEIDNSMGSVHGGAIAALIDHTLSLAVYPLVAPGVWVATTNMSVQYLHPVRSGDCFADGTVVSLGTRQAVVRVEVTNAGRTVAVAVGGIMVRERETPRTATQP
ncbi:MAG: PaaI family thioesterase [Deltaproteobacteria bacterium]|nr:PaaI family thioesterase [Deltaproteobacteria bacterium]